MSYLIAMMSLCGCAAKMDLHLTPALRAYGALYWYLYAPRVGATNEEPKA